MRIVAEGDSVKYSEYRRSGRATLCVATTVQAGRRYVSVGLPRRGARQVHSPRTFRRCGGMREEATTGKRGDSVYEFGIE